MKGIIALTLLSLAVLGSAINFRGPVAGVIDCGSAGRILEVRVRDCFAVPCHMTPGEDYLTEIDFVASGDSNGLNLKVWVTLPIGQFPIADLPINGQIVGGLSYTLRYELPVHYEVAGLTITVRFEVTDVATTRMEVCTVSDAVIDEIP